MKAMLVNDQGMPIWSDVENPIIKNDEEVIIPINVEVNPDATIVISSSLEGFLFTFCISRFLNYMQ